MQGRAGETMLCSEQWAKSASPEKDRKTSNLLDFREEIGVEPDPWSVPKRVLGRGVEWPEPGLPFPPRTDLWGSAWTVQEALRRLLDLGHVPDTVPVLVKGLRPVWEDLGGHPDRTGDVIRFEDGSQLLVSHLIAWVFPRPARKERKLRKQQVRW